MSSVNSHFIGEIKSFVHNHKMLCVLTLGLAVVGYVVGKLAGRTVSWIAKSFGSTEKTDQIGRRIISSFNEVFDPVPQRPEIEKFIEELKGQKGVEIKGNKDDTWHEIVFDNNPYQKNEVNCQWKLHISAGSNVMTVLRLIKPILLKNRPYCKIVQNQDKLFELENTLDVNGKKVYKGKCLTIYPKSEPEALALAIALDQAISGDFDLINQDKQHMPCTDRPLGKSGYLWSRNDLAGGPIDEEALKSCDHAHAMVGNYNTTIILPKEAYEFETDESGRQAYKEWYDSEFANFERIVHKDIFAETFGNVKWIGEPESDQGRFETEK